MIAGEFAPRVAGLWPAPHGPFLQAPAERRHLVCLALAGRNEQLGEAEAAAALGGSFRRAVKSLAPQAPPGLARALGRLGEFAWRGEDYLRLIRLLGEPQVAPLLNHAEALCPRQLKAIEQLSPTLRAAGFVKAGLNDGQSALLAELHGALVRRDGPVSAEAAARRWAAGNSAKDIFVRAAASVRCELPTPPFPDGGQLRAIRTLAALDEVGGSFHNCVGTLPHAGDPDYAWYEWGGEPPAVVCLHRDRLYGWSLCEAKAPRNALLPPASREAINAVLEELGVHVGLTAWDMHRALLEAVRPAGVAEITPAAAIGWRYGDDD